MKQFLKDVVRVLSCFALYALADDPKCFVTQKSTESLYMGSTITDVVLSKVFSLQYNIPLYYRDTEISTQFQYSVLEKNLKEVADLNSFTIKSIDWADKLSDGLVDSFRKQNVQMLVGYDTVLERVDPQWVSEAKKIVKLKNDYDVNQMPEGCITIAIHIRKGNGGLSHLNDGEMVSEQLFEHDRRNVRYLLFSEWINYPWEVEQIRRNAQGYVIAPHRIWYGNNLDEQWSMKYPPEQYYIDQINWLAQRLKDVPLFVQIFTADINPPALIERIKSKVNNENITFFFHNNRDKDIQTIILEDLYNISRFSIFIRGQSYFARAAELIGNHAVVIYPVESRWEKDNGKSKNIMKTIVVKTDKEGELLFK